MNQRVDQLEIKISYLEEANTQLSDELIRQRHEIEALRAQVAALAGRVETAREPATVYTAEDEKPPHY
jgi:SlyX protein